MFPSTTPNDLVNKGGANVVAGRKAGMELTGNGQSADFTHLLLGKFCPVMSGAMYTPGQVLSALLDHVLNVSGLVSEEQMIGVDAEFHVATMQHLQAVRNGTVREDVGKAMGEDVTVMPVNLPVPRVYNGSGPKPATRLPIGACPEMASELFVGYNVHVFGLLSTKGQSRSVNGAAGAFCAQLDTLHYTTSHARACARAV